MPPATARVRHRGVTRRFRTGGSLLVLRRSVARAFSLPSALPALAFETAPGDRAAVDTDLALRIAAAAPPAAGTIIVAPPGALLSVSVSDCIHTVFAAMVDTAARGEFAAAFLAMSAAWDPAKDAASDSSDDDIPSRPASPIPARTPMCISPVSSRPSSPRPLSPRAASPRLVVARPLSPRPGPSKPTSRPTSRPSSPLPHDGGVVNLSSAQDVQHPSAEACFCTHFGVECGHCKSAAIQGTRYRCTSCAEVNLCEKCRRSGAHCADRHCYTVYDHPWEATEEYLGHAAADAFRAPLAPLALGDRGPRVMHLHFVLYTLGYLFLFAPDFRVDSFTTATRDAVELFQIDYASDWDAPVDQNPGAYSARTRASILSRFEDLELRVQTNCRAEAAAATGPRLRSALAA